MGIDEQIIDSISDHRVLLMARKSMMFDKLVKEAPEVTKRVGMLPPKVVKPGAATQASNDARVTAFNKLKQSGRAEDAASVFATMF